MPFYEPLEALLLFSWRKLKEANDQLEDIFFLYVAGTFFLWTLRQVRALLNGELLRQYSSDKVIQEKRVVVGWNALQRVTGVADSPSSSSSSSNSSSSSSKAPRRRRSLSAPRGRAPAASPGSLAHAVQEFQQQVRNGEIRLQLFTEATLNIEECVNDPSLIDRYVAAAQRRIDEDADLSSDVQNLEDFLIVFEYAEGEIVNHTFSSLLTAHWGLVYSRLLQVFLGNSIFQICLPDTNPGIFAAKTFETILVIQNFLYILNWIGILVFGTVMLFNLFIARFPHRLLERAAFIPAFLKGQVEAAFQHVKKKQVDDQNIVMRALLNKVSEKLASSNWPGHCSKLRGSVVPDEFWEKSRIQRGRYFMVATCEKEPGVLMMCTRLWLIHPWDLFLLTHVSRDDISHSFRVDVEGVRKKGEENEKRYPFVGHRLRLFHLRQWGLLEFNPDGTRKDSSLRRHTTQEVEVPQNAN